MRTIAFPFPTFPDKAPAFMVLRPKLNVAFAVPLSDNTYEREVAGPVLCCEIKCAN